MKSKKKLLEDAKEIATETIATTKEHIFIAFEYGKKLANYYKADETIVLVGLYLMDSKLKEARKQNKKQEHTQMAVEFAKEFLKGYDITKVEYDKIINCIEAHHGKVPFQCLEAEICANADCYRFIHPKGVMAYLPFLSKKLDYSKDIITKAKEKLDEKKKLLSLEKAKNDLTNYYSMFSEIFLAVLNNRKEDISQTNYNSYYEKIGEEYNKIRLDSDNNMENVIRMIKKYTPRKDATILDIGCGTGKYGELMEKHDFKVVGIDQSETQIKQATQLIEAYHEDATNLSFADNTFDICTMIIMIQQLTKENRLKALKEAYRVLKPNGILLIKTCSHSDLESRFTAKYFPRTLEIDQKRYPDIEELKSNLSDFKEIKIENSSVLVKKEKEKLIERFQKRGTSNLSFLTEEELNEGIKKFEEDYQDKIIEKEVKNTFVIARKG